MSNIKTCSEESTKANKCKRENEQIKENKPLKTICEVSSDDKRNKNVNLRNAADSVVYFVYQEWD